jgi:hypothetical protein
MSCYPEGNYPEHTLVFVVKEWAQTMCDGRHGVNESMMNTRDSLARRPIAALLLVLLTGCQVWQPAIADPVTLIPAEEPGSVRVTLLDGARLTVRDPIMRNDSIVATLFGGAAVAASDVRLLEVQRFDAKKTIGFVIAGVVLAAAWTQAVLGTKGGEAEPPDPEDKLR